MEKQFSSPQTKEELRLHLPAAA